ncbi:MAG: heparan-alpha-glucosaminide N-acetyltransferase [Candidatus Thermoplasmatota archaeon]|nr:heparan-alpha-glucosaminide N-acetyltransferase [Candidatus Thermoplasmatota archaeon]
MNDAAGKRFWEIDVLRSIAIILMVTYHVFYDLDFFGAYHIDKSSGFWWLFPRAIATTFISLVGISLAISYSRERARKPESSLFPKYLKRGLVVLSFGMGVTAATWIFLGDYFVKFGILHLIGVSIILAYPFLGKRLPAIIAGASIILLGLLLKSADVSVPWLLWLWPMPKAFPSVDYFPVLPWLGAALIGVFIGGVLYSGNSRIFRLPDLSGRLLIRALQFLGRRSLAIYLVHQPAILAVLYIINVANVRDFL